MIERRLYILEDGRLHEGQARVWVCPCQNERQETLRVLQLLASSRSPWVTYSQHLTDYEFVDASERTPEGFPITHIKPKWNALTFTSWDGEPFGGLVAFWRSQSS